MPNSHGTPIWYELIATDVDKTRAFYETVMGWTTAPFGEALQDGAAYHVFSAADGQGVGGLMRAPDPGMAPGWYFYIGVDDVDAAAASLADAGGSVHMPPTDLEGVGRLAFVADPQGIPFYLMRGASPEASTAFRRGAIGHAEWNELRTSDDHAGLAFYTGQFGWTRDGAMPMGEMGDYSFLGHAGEPIGAVMKALPGEQPRWGHFFRVDGIDVAKQRIEDAGGTINRGPIEVPGGDFVIYALDLEGGSFGVVGSR